MQNTLHQAVLCMQAVQCKACRDETKALTHDANPCTSDLPLGGLALLLHNRSGCGID